MQAEARSRVNLRQLVYGSLEPIIEANAQMSQSMVETILKFSDDKGHDDDGYPIVQLKTLQLVYDQLRHDDLDMLYSEKIGLEIPLLSIIPLSGLKVSKSKINFSTEVQEIEHSNGTVNIYTKVAASESDRSALSSRIDFEIEMESDSVAEGLARLIDQLGQNFVPTIHGKDPIDPEGNKLDDDDRQHHETKKELHRQEQRLAHLLSQLTGMQRSDEDKTDDEEDLSVYKPLEVYKDRLNRKLAEVRREILEHDIVHELSQDEETPKQEEIPEQTEEKTRNDRRERKRKPTDK